MTQQHSSQRGLGATFLSPSALLLASAAFLSADLWQPSSALAVGTRHFVLEGASDFGAGELEGVSINSDESLVPGLDLAKTEIKEAPIAWSAMEHEGQVLIATGPEGKLLIQKGADTRVIEAPDTLALTSITRAFGNRIFVGSIPAGKIFELKGDKLEVFTTLEGAAHIWGLAFDEQAKVLYAATGPEGKIMRITADGTAQDYFKAEESHFMSVAVHEGKVFAGSSGSGLLYQIEAPGRARVVFDFETTEVRALRFNKEGELFAIANDVKGGPRTDNINPTRLNAPSENPERGGSGVLYRFAQDLTPEKLYASPQEMLVFLDLDAAGDPYVGTGSEGRLIQIGKEHQTTVLADLEERQVIWAKLEGKGGWILGSDPVVAHKIRGFGGVDALWTSSVLDAGLRAQFGRLNFEGEGKVEYSTRTGNTSEPDGTWSEWSAAMTKPSEIKSPEGRFFQIRARMVDGVSASLSKIDVSFITDNLRPIVTAVTANSNAQVEGSRGLSPSGATNDSEAATNITITWQVDNPDQDQLRYFVEYRPAGTETWTSLLEPTDVYTKPTYDWDTTHIPEGSYVFQITASDELSNPVGSAKEHKKTSSPITVDNTAPQIEGLRVVGSRVDGIAVDGIGPIRSIDVQLNGQGRYYSFAPKDGIFDEKKEEFSLDLSSIVEKRPAMAVIRVFDTAGNSTVAHVTLRAGGQ